MPNVCIAACCSNVSSTSSPKGVKVYTFPKDPELRKQWTKQVQRTRASWSGPTKYSCLCSEHFTDDCFDPSHRIRESLGFGTMQRNLTNDAVPTIFTIKGDKCRPNKRQAVNNGASGAAKNKIRTRKQVSMLAIYSLPIMLKVKQEHYGFLLTLTQIIYCRIMCYFSGDDCCVFLCIFHDSVCCQSS